MNRKGDQTRNTNRTNKKQNKQRAANKNQNKGNIACDRGPYIAQLRLVWREQPSNKGKANHHKHRLAIKDLWKKSNTALCWNQGSSSQEPKITQSKSRRITCHKSRLAKGCETKCEMVWKIDKPLFFAQVAFRRVYGLGESNNHRKSVSAQECPPNFNHEDDWNMDEPLSLRFRLDSTQ